MPLLAHNTKIVRDDKENRHRGRRGVKNRYDIKKRHSRGHEGIGGRGSEHQAHLRDRENSVTTSKSSQHGTK